MSHAEPVWNEAKQPSVIVSIVVTSQKITEFEENICSGCRTAHQSKDMQSRRSYRIHFAMFCQVDEFLVHMAGRIAKQLDTFFRR